MAFSFSPHNQRCTLSSQISSVAHEQRALVTENQDNINQLSSYLSGGLHLNASIRKHRNELRPLEAKQRCSHWQWNQTGAEKNNTARVHSTTASMQSLPSVPGVQRAASSRIAQPSPSQRPSRKTSDLPEPHATCCLVLLPATLVSWNIPETSSPTLNETAVLTTYKEAGNPAMLFQPWKPHEKLYRQLSLPFPVFFIQASPKDGLARERRFAELFVINPGFH